MKNSAYNQYVVFDACVNGKLRELSQRISEKKIEVNGTNDYGSTPLMMAVQYDNVRVVKLILENGGDINLKFEKGDSALAIAIFNNNPEVVAILLEHEPSMVNVNEHGDSALMWALNRREFWKYDTTYENGVRKVQNKHSVEGFSYVPITLADMRFLSQKILDLILEYLLNSGDQEHMDYFKLCQAIINDDIEDVKRQLSEIEDVNFCHVTAEIPLAFAVVTNQLEIAKVLLEGGMSPEPNENLNRQSLLVTWIWSSEWNEKCVEMLELLLKFKAKPQKDILHVACKHEFWNCARLLIMYSADVNNYSDETEETPFHIACRIADVEILKLMVKHGANLLKTGKSGKTVLHLAARNNNPGSFSYIVSLAISQGYLDVNVRDANGCTPLHAASGICDNFFLLLKNGADLNIDSKRRYAPIHFHDNNNERTLCPVSDYMHKLKLLGYNIARFIFADISSSLLDLCKQEQEKLKNSVITWIPRATLLDVLYMKRNEMARFSVNENLEQIFEESNKDFETIYPCFGSVLNVQYRRGLKRRDLLDLGKTSLAEVLGTRIPEASAELILEYLNNSEMVAFGNVKWDSL